MSDVFNSTRRRRWPLLAGVAGLAALAVLPYAGSWQAPFIYDDEPAIVENPHLRQLWPLGQALQAPPQSPVAGRPAVSLTLALNYAAGGLDPWGYHLVNTLLHALNGCLLFALLRETYAAVWSTEAASHAPNRRATALAWSAAAVWVVHPLNSEAVIYTTQRTELLMAFSYLSTLWAAARAWRSRRPIAWSILAVLGCALGMAAKETMASAPLMVLLYDRAFHRFAWREAPAWRLALYVALAATWIVLAWSMTMAPRDRSAGFHLGVSGSQYLATQCDIVPRYLGLVFWPNDLCLDHGAEMAISWRQVVPGAALLSLLAAGTLVAWWRWPPVGYAGLFCAAVLAPSSSVIPIITEPYAERRMYLPLGAIAATMVALAAVLLGALARRGGWPSRLAPALGGGAVAGLLAVLSLITLQRAAVYNDVEAIWNDALVKRPLNPRAHYQWAVLAARRHDQATAQTHLTVAAMLRPEHRVPTAAHRRLETGLRHWLRGHDAQALEELQNALAIDADLELAQYLVRVIELRRPAAPAS